jgi:DNA-binding transcriptional ArsR family regulator
MGGSLSDKVVTKIESIEKTLREVLNWLKVANIPQLRETLTRELDSEDKKLVYELTDGIRSQYEIESITKVSRRMVSYYWQKWYGLGLLVTSEKRKGRMQRIVSLDEVGIGVPSRPGKQTILSETEFEPKDLKKILSSEKVFPEAADLYNFARDILQPMGFPSSTSRSELVDTIARAFEQSDQMKKNLFIQALERRTLEKESTEFKKFFDAWEEQIGR